MKKVTTKTVRADDDYICAEYGFTGGVRGKHYQAIHVGYTVTIHKSGGTTIIKDIKPKEVQWL